MNDWTLSLSSKTDISVMHIDLCHAVDSVTHVKLFARLYSYGIQGDLLRWFTEFFYRKHTSNSSQFKFVKCC